MLGASLGKLWFRRSVYHVSCLWCLGRGYRTRGQSFMDLMQFEAVCALLCIPT